MRMSVMLQNINAVNAVLCTSTSLYLPVLGCFTCAYTLFRLSYIDSWRRNGPRECQFRNLENTSLCACQNATNRLQQSRRWFEEQLEG